VPQANGAAPSVDPAITKRLRELAVPLLCSMAHSTGRARSALAAADGHAVLLGALTDRTWQVRPRTGLHDCPTLSVTASTSEDCSDGVVSDAGPTH